MDILDIFSKISLLLSIVIHEFVHCFVADRLGDPTPRSQGRITLNPLKHLDPLGTLMILTGPIGWGKPAIIDPYNFKNPRRDETIVALSGPTSNLLLALAAASIAKLIYPNYLIVVPLYLVILQNIYLAIFNLLPVPPLDGSKLFLNLVPQKDFLSWRNASQKYGYIILAILILLPFGSSNLISLILVPVANFLLKLLFPSGFFPASI